MCDFRFLSAVLLVLLAICNGSSTAADVTPAKHNDRVAENRLTTQVLAIVDHFKQPDPVGIPGAPVPEPMNIPPIDFTVSIAKIKLTNTTVYGLSRFRIKYSKIDLNSLKATAIVYLEKMHMEGTYKLAAMFSTKTGPFTIDMEDVHTYANVTLGVNLDGKLETQDIAADIQTNKKIEVDFKNLGMMDMIQTLMKSAANAVFDAMKPFMLSEAYAKIKEKMDSALESASKDFILPNSISPLDMAIAEGRKKFRQMGYDPYHVPAFNQTAGVFSIQSKDTMVEGVSSFYRVGNITMTMVNNTVIAAFQVGSQKIRGSTKWEAAVGGMMSRGGQASFTLQHLKVYLAVEQPLDIRNRPKIRDMQIELGNIQVRCDGAGTLDYVVEFIVNILPNLLRYQIMDAIENPLKARVQEEINKYDVEKVLREQLPKFEQMGLKMDFDFKFEL